VSAASSVHESSLLHGGTARSAEAATGAALELRRLSAFYGDAQVQRGSGRSLGAARSVWNER